MEAVTNYPGIMDDQPVATQRPISPQPDLQGPMLAADAAILYDRQRAQQEADFERIWGSRAHDDASARQQAATHSGIEREVTDAVPAALYVAVEEAARKVHDAHRQAESAKQAMEAHARSSYTAADVPARSVKRQQLEGEYADYQELARQADAALERAKAAVQRARHAAWQRLGLTAEQEYAQAAAHAGAEQRAAEEETRRRIAAAEQVSLAKLERLNRLRAFRP